MNCPRVESNHVTDGAPGVRSGGPPSVVVADQLSVSFPRRSDPVLNDVSLTLAPGEQVIVFAPSGAGKSTLLRALTGVIPQSVVATLTGTVEVCGHSTASTPVVELSRHVSVLAQDPSSALCLPDVEQELALPLENRGVDPQVISGRIDSALAAVGATALRLRKTGQLSGGEAQRVALAASLIAEQDVLLLDEPTSMLDAMGISSVRAAIASAVDAYRPAMLLVEHRVDEFAGSRGLAGLPVRAIVLGEDGQILADGPTATVLHSAAPALHAAGCWLPLEAELQAIFGIAGGLSSPGVRAALTECATPAAGESANEYDDVVLSASGLAIGRRAEKSLLHKVNLELRAGEIVAVLGANGSGKTTLLLTMAGLLDPQSGSVHGARPGMIFQNPEHQFVATSVRSEVGHGMPANSTAVIDALLAEHHLTHLASQNPYRLSGGEKRRLSVAAMLAQDRPSLLADEPTFGLDRRATITTMGAFRAAANDGRAIMFSSHDLRTVATLAHRVVVIAAGTLIADGPALTVLRDHSVLARANITLPPLIDWLLESFDSNRAIQHILDYLDATVSAKAPA